MQFCLVHNRSYEMLAKHSGEHDMQNESCCVYCKPNSESLSKIWGKVSLFVQSKTLRVICESLDCVKRYHQGIDKHERKVVLNIAQVSFLDLYLLVISLHIQFEGLLLCSPSTNMFQHVIIQRDISVLQLIVSLLDLQHAIFLREVNASFFLKVGCWTTPQEIFLLSFIV